MNNNLSFLRQLPLLSGYLLAKSLLLCLIFVGSSCNQTDEPETPGINLSAEDVGVTDALVRIRMPEGKPGTRINLERDGRTIMSLDGSRVIDSIIAIDSLRPRHTYAVRAHVAPDIGSAGMSNVLSFTTMDTTSHTVQWQTTYFGHGLSTLYDVAIINDSTAIAVGEIYLTGDSSAFPYAVAWWRNGTWSLQRVLVRDAGVGNYGYARITCVHAFNQQDIWVSTGAELLHWNGFSWSSKAWVLDTLPFTKQVTKIWGTGGDNIYMVGRYGALYHYNGHSCSVIASNTTLDFTDIYGAINPAKTDTEIYAVAANRMIGYDKVILRINPNGVESVPMNGITHQIVSFWFKPSSLYLVVGDGFFSSRSPIHWPWSSEGLGVTTYYTDRIRGTELNNIAICTDFGDLVRFNGISWRSHRVHTGLTNGRYNSMDMKETLIIAVGDEDDKAALTVGRR